MLKRLLTLLVIGGVCAGVLIVLIDFLTGAPRIDTPIASQVVGSTASGEATSGMASLLVTTLVLAVIILSVLAFSLWKKTMHSIDSLNLAVNEVRSAIRSHHVAANSDQGRESRGDSTHGQALLEISQSLGAFRRAIEEREEEIKRLKKGYDAYLYARYARQVIDIFEAAEDARKAHADNLLVQQTHELVEQLFADWKIEKFYPPIGELFKTTEGVGDHPKKISTDDPSQHGRIAAVSAPGYRLLAGSVPQILAPAKVEVFVYSTPNPQN
jgi:hypothetical protein